MKYTIIHKTVLYTQVFVCCSFLSYGQSNVDQSYYMRYTTIGPFSPAQYFPVEYQELEEYLQNKKISDVWVQGEEINKKGKVKSKHYWHKYSIDENGKVKRFEGGFKGKDTRYSYDYLNYADGSFETVYKKRNGKLKERKIMKETKGSDKLYSRDTYVLNAKGDTISRTILSPRDTVNMNSNDYYYKNGKLKYTWFNEYYPDKSLKKTSFYNGKGKLKYVWDYQCKEEGMEVKKHKDTSTVCVSKEYDQDSILTTIYHTIGTDGNITKTINKRNRKGKFISYKRTKGVDDLPVSEYNLTYATDDTTLISSISYGYAKGKLISERKKSFDDEMNLTSSSFKSYKKGVLKEEIVYTFEYDTQGRPIKKVANKKNSGTQEIWNLSYSQKFASK